MSLPQTMKGVVLEGPREIVVRDMPAPTIQEDRDVILKVHMAGLCGSDLHWYRGQQDMSNFKPFIMGHESFGEVVAVGKGVKSFKLGDMAISPFSLSCGSCFYCEKGLTARCVRQISIGNPAVPGAQAEYIRIAMADSSLFHCPTDIPRELCLMLTDILPTGYSIAMNAWRLPDEEKLVTGAGEGEKKAEMRRKGVCVVIGCGPVGLCAITAAKTLFETVFATDLAPHRLELAKKHGATALPKDELIPAVLEATEGRGADAVLEVVGHISALETALQIVRPYGVISVGGVHTGPVTLPGLGLYGKNVRIQFGRCAHHTFFEPAYKVLKDNLELFSSFVEHMVPFGDAAEYYRLFDGNKISKTAFVADFVLKEMEAKKSSS